MTRTLENGIVITTYFNEVWRLIYDNLSINIELLDTKLKVTMSHPDFGDGVQYPLIDIPLKYGELDNLPDDLAGKVIDEVKEIALDYSDEKVEALGFTIIRFFQLRSLHARVSEVEGALEGTTHAIDAFNLMSLTGDPITLIERGIGELRNEINKLEEKK